MTPSVISVDRLSSLIAPGSRIVVGQGTSEPLGLTQALMRQRHAIGPLRIFLGVVSSETFRPEDSDGIAFSSFGALGNAARLAKAGRLDIHPVHYGKLPELFAGGHLGADVVLLQLAPAADGSGLSLGLANDYVAAASRRARLVVAEVNPDAPWTYGAEIPADLRIDHYVEATQPPVELKPSRCGETEEEIAARVAALIPDAATIQTGIGAIPDAILTALHQHRELGIHSGMIGDRVADLIESGVVTNSRKPFDRGVSVAGLLLGTHRLNAFARRNPSLRVCPPSHTHAVAVLARIPGFIAINSAIEVDLSGQVNAEMANGQYVGAVGGQVDFVRGANASPGGRSIIAMPATAKHGEISRVVASLGGPVTSLRSDSDAIVTEHGVAELRGRTLAERAHCMIAIAAPQFREALSRSAHGILRAVG
ncbi:acetyl-CoA hydrolase [Rhizobiales bacterium GAS191]|nr:acetyl-CoA hydrolase [Rhizobiales bacterium GAS191]